jgi:UrcA family protein
MNRLARACNLAVKTFCAVMTLSSMALPALAADADVPQHAVHYSDLDVSREPGATVLYHRIASAATLVCTALDGADLASKMRYKACVNKAVTDAVTTAGQPMLVAVYQAKHRILRRTVASSDSGQASVGGAP